MNFKVSGLVTIGVIGDDLNIVYCHRAVIGAVTARDEEQARRIVEAQACQRFLPAWSIDVSRVVVYHEPAYGELAGDD